VQTAEDNLKRTNVQLKQQQHEFGTDETDSDDDMARNHTAYTEEDDDEAKIKYKMDFQNPNMIGSSSNMSAPPPPAAAAATTAAAPTTSAAPTSNTFLAVQ
jgi:hypothetical protein